MKRQCMVDIETLSSQPDAAVIAIGLCLFNHKEILDSRQFLIDPRYAPGHRDIDTLEWWQNQDSGVFTKMMSGEAMPWEICHEMYDLCRHEWKTRTIWANAPTFDISILRQLFKLYDIGFPFHFSKEMDYRTVKHFAKEMGIDFNAPLEERSAHDAESDAIAQAKALQIMLRDLALVGVS